MIQHGMVATYNHPIWSRVREEEFINTEGIWALEIYNYNTVNESNTGYDETYFDVMLREGKKILLLHRTTIIMKEISMTHAEATSWSKQRG